MLSFEKISCEWWLALICVVAGPRQRLLPAERTPVALVVGPLPELGGPVEGADVVAVVEEVAAPTAASGLQASALAAVDRDTGCVRAAPMRATGKTL